MGFYLELIRKVFQAVDENGKLRNRVVAFTAATPREGVTYTVDLLARELATQSHKRVLTVDAAAFQTLYLADPNQVSRHCVETEIENLLTLRSPELAPSAAGRERIGDWHARPDYRTACLKALRWNFDYVLIDCSSLAVSSEAATLAPIVDGISVVVKAAKTRRSQIQRCQQIIESAGGNFLGFVLNQRQYPVPSWLYRRL
ncbi:MAG TPA: hypothetical protein VGW36_05315 [Pyrinomonadaceae bacterium]|nr:hypothetical protein [Pyrinomonadaceae bacterium]